jgi:Mrp family chromosome partitioning ATPase
MKGLNVIVGTGSREQRGIADGPGWINPTAETGGIARYWEAIRGSWWLIVLTVIGCVGASLLILSRSDKVYESSSYLVVSPISDRDGVYNGLSILRESTDPARNLETLSRAITTPVVAQQVKAKIKVDGTARSLLEGIEAVPVAGSDLVEIHAKASSPLLARRLANAFAQATIEYRTARLHDEADKIIAGLKPLVRRSDSAPTTRQLTPREESQQVVAARLAQLQALRANPDPTVRLDTPAALQRTPVSPKPLLSIIVSSIAGLLIGVGGVLGLQLVDPRVRSERQLRELYRLPILARVPKLRRRFGISSRAAASAMDSYQSLRVALMGAGRGLGGVRTVFLTGASRRDGKTTTAVGLARALAQTGQRTTLVEADARNPSVGSAMGVSSETGLMGVASASTPVSEALIQPAGESTNLNVLLAEHRGEWLRDVLAPATADRLLTELDEVSDWIVFDSAPLGQVLDALPLAILSSQLLLVVRLGKSQLSELKRLAETLDQHGIRPTGFVVIGGSHTSYPG